MSEKTCASCRYFYREQQGPPAGELTVCRFNPPMVFITRIHRADDNQQIVGTENYSLFPPVKISWCCGQFSRKLALVEQEGED